MLNPMYSYRASDGNTYQGTQDQLRGWAAEGRIRLEDFVTNVETGQDAILRDVLYPVQGQIANPVGAYPRGTPAVTVSAAELKKFHWGAFLLNWIWGINHRKYITLVAIPIGCVPFVGGLLSLGFAIYVGVNGNQWAWESGRFATLEECRECQKIWTRWGVGVLIAEIAVGITAGIIIAMLPNSSSVR